MNREIKFRVWDSKENRFLEETIMWSVVKMPEEQILHGSPPWIPFITFAIHSPYYTAQQFTGLKDKNGKEIYEGDIIKMSDGSVVDICHDDCGRGWILGSREIEQFADYEWLVDHNLYSEVIGNIFENPSLLS